MQSAAVGQSSPGCSALRTLKMAATLPVCHVLGRYPLKFGWTMGFAKPCLGSLWNDRNTARRIEVRQRDVGIRPSRERLLSGGGSKSCRSRRNPDRTCTHTPISISDTALTSETETTGGVGGIICAAAGLPILFFSPGLHSLFAPGCSLPPMHVLFSTPRSTHCSSSGNPASRGSRSSSTPTRTRRSCRPRISNSTSIPACEQRLAYAPFAKARGWSFRISACLEGASALVVKPYPSSFLIFPGT